MRGTPRRGKGCTRQSTDLTPHRYPDRQSAACVIFASYLWTHLWCEGSEGSKGSEGGGLPLRAMSFISRLRRSRQHRVSILSAYLVHPFPLRGTSPRWEACHWIRGSRGSPMNPIPLPPQGETRALRDWLSMSYGMKNNSANWLAALASPYPASPDFHLKVKRLTMICASLALLHPLLSLTHWIFRSLIIPYKSSSHSANHVRCASTGKRVTRFSGRFASLRIVFPCHPCSGGRIKHLEASLRKRLCSKHGFIVSHHEVGGKVVRQPPKGGDLPRPPGRL